MSSCCNGGMAYPFPYYSAFTWATPTIPNLYWNAYSQEERIKNLCMEYGKMTAYLDAMADTLNSQYRTIEEINDKLPSMVAEVVTTDPDIRKSREDTVNTYIEGMTKGTTYKQMTDHGFVYNGLIGA